MSGIHEKNGVRDKLPQCHTCLSVNRKLFPIWGKANECREFVLCQFRSVKSLEQLRLCWECYSILQKIATFRNNVEKANDLLQNSQSYLFGTLSSLTTTVVENGTHNNVIYVAETNISDETKNERIEKIKVEENYDEFNTHLVDEDEKFTHLNQLNEPNEIVKPNDHVNETLNKKVNKAKITDGKKNKINKWFMKRALKNKKPKFEMLTAKDLKFEDVFRLTELCMENKRCEKLNEEKSVLSNNERYAKRDSANDLISENRATRYECTLCSYISNSITVAQKHLDTHNKVWKCLKCGLKFVDKHEFNNHFKDWHEKFICDICGVSFKMRYCIKKHIRTQHSRFQCKDCDKSFVHYKSMWIHRKYHHMTAGDREAYCVECDRRYPNRMRYKAHLANSVKHTAKEKKRFPCPDCDKVFTKNIYMKNHYDLVHLKQYTYRCEDCNKNFTRNACLLKHKRLVHEGIVPPKNKICYVCGRGFTTNKILTNHIRTHTGERPFACDACPARFAQKTALTTHVRALHQNSARNLATST